METCSSNVDHEYQKPIEELNMLLLNTQKKIVNAFGTIDWVTKEGWPQIPRWQANKKSVKTLKNSGSNDQPLERELFGTTSNLDLVNTRTFLTPQPSIIATMMNVNALTVVILATVLCIQLLKYHDNDYSVIHI
jgi:hypothetical protein